MVRTQIYLTEDQRAAIVAIASQSGKRQSEVFREAVDRFVEQKSGPRREAILGEAADIWRDRTDLPDFDGFRRGWHRN